MGYVSIPWRVATPANGQGAETDEEATELLEKGLLSLGPLSCSPVYGKIEHMESDHMPV